MSKPTDYELDQFLLAFNKDFKDVFWEVWHSSLLSEKDKMWEVVVMRCVLAIVANTWKPDNAQSKQIMYKAQWLFKHGRRV